MFGHGAKDCAEVSAGEFLQAFTHRLHAEHEKSEATDHF
jgi:hypothetical protein